MGHKWPGPLQQGRKKRLTRQNLETPEGTPQASSEQDIQKDAKGR